MAFPLPEVRLADVVLRNREDVVEVVRFLQDPSVFVPGGGRCTAVRHTQVPAQAMLQRMARWHFGVFLRCKRVFEVVLQYRNAVKHHLTGQEHPKMPPRHAL